MAGCNSWSVVLLSIQLSERNASETLCGEERCLAKRGEGLLDAQVHGRDRKKARMKHVGPATVLKLAFNMV